MGAAVGDAGDPASWPALLRETFSAEPIWLTTPSPFPAVKVYQAPDRDEVLFARSPLRRLQLTPAYQNDRLSWLMIHCSDHSLHSYQVTPGRSSQTTFLRATRICGCSARSQMKSKTWTLGIPFEQSLAEAEEAEVKARTEYVANKTEESFKVYQAARKKVEAVRRAFEKAARKHLARRDLDVNP